jgi:xylose isomerase
MASRECFNAVKTLACGISSQRGEFPVTLIPKLGAHCGAWDRHANRFNPRGYQEPLPLPEIIRQVARVPDLKGLDLSRSMVEKVPLSEIKTALAETGLRVISVAASISGHPRWLHGAFTNPDPQLRRQAIQVVKETMDLVLELGGSQVNLWFGREGFDYCFEADYAAEWQYLVDGLRDCAAYQPDARIAIEYKSKEPLSHLLVGTAATALLLCEDVGAPNVGVLLDTGHALLAQENLAQVAVMLARRNRLFHIHLNDNYRSWDDDMVPGSVHWVEFVEMFYWLERIGYNGWFMCDAQSAGYTPETIMKTSAAFVRGLTQVLGGLDLSALAESIGRGDGLECLSSVQNKIFGIADSRPANQGVLRDD